MTEDFALLHVCTTCRAGLPLADGGVPMGADLYAGIAARLARTDAPVVLRKVECLATCERGCTATISMPGKWTYLLGGLNPAMADDIVDYARSYVVSRTGTIMPSRRADSLKDMILARFPAQDAVIDAVARTGIQTSIQEAAA
jgi:predicted metal-binding protein